VGDNGMWAGIYIYIYIPAYIYVVVELHGV